MQVEQAVFTSLSRAGRAGYHVVSRSPGVTEADARALAAWSPSHGALIVDEANRCSLNVVPLGADRYLLSRTCEGAPEYSGRGGRQLYTHAILFDDRLLAASRYQPVSIYRAAMSLGVLRYRPDPEPALPTVELPHLYPERNPAWCHDRLIDLGVPSVEELRSRLTTGRSMDIHHVGDRIQIADCLFGLLPPEAVKNLSLSTSLVASPSRPFRLSLSP